MKLEIYWSFRSPYSYLVTDRLVALARDFMALAYHVQSQRDNAGKSGGSLTRQQEAS